MSPLDLRAGGTWLGVSERGLFAAVTNRRCLDPDPNRRSRGEIVNQALRAERAEDAAEAFGDLPRGSYNPFNAFVADTQRAFVVTYQDAPEVKELSPGVHVIGNVDPSDLDHPKIRRVRSRAESAAGHERHDVLSELEGVCREHLGETSSLEDTCVHLEAYGTRSSTLLMLGEEARDHRLLYCEGPPCQSQFTDFTPLLDELSQPASYGSEELATGKAS